MRILVFFVVPITSFLYFSFYEPRTENEDEYTYNSTAVQESEVSLLFSGDVFLGRDVERRNITNDPDRPFKVYEHFTHVDANVVNFEAPIPNFHIPTPDFGFQFSVSTDFIPSIKRAGITHVSLANNHTLDHGSDGYQHTKDIFIENNITPFGHPVVLDDDSIAYIKTDVGTISLIGIHTLFTVPSTDDVMYVFNKARNSSDFVIAYVHWGEEYVQHHNSSQFRFAQLLVEAEADLIIGHHPHVIQDIQIIDGVPIIYSLGNTIFDQYFSLEVQKGLFIELTMTSYSDIFKIYLHPVTSLGTPTVPRLMEGDDKNKILTDIAERSDPVFFDQIIEGVITVDRGLRTR